jgi:hypothetical protein
LGGGGSGGRDQDFRGFSVLQEVRNRRRQQPQPFEGMPAQGGGGPQPGRFQGQPGLFDRTVPVRNIALDRLGHELHGVLVAKRRGLVGRPENLGGSEGTGQMY